ncbi:glutamate-rich protein 1 isoform X4 [Neofelis nebulosa]|uniref:glutamate-rich protein 1 isoform X4 n=1 Tax=Neofelis nebulosa TaxID=61452 RepID=UPI00272D5D97|nr:glutamate-rich protein 1 isoform X4 [Neofelis nebulosa]
MAALRRHVFVEKVLRRLFPSVPCGQEKRVLVAPASGNSAERVATTDLRGRSAPTLTGGDSKVPPRRRLYTASLPPEGYVPAPPEPQASPASEDSSGSDDAGKGCPLSGICQDPGPAVLPETTQELFKHLDSHGLSPSDVLLLDHMKSLLLLQDTKGLTRALETFPERCTLPAGAGHVFRRMNEKGPADFFAGMSK